ncbi:MAG: crossover junction endodeoxyribonuclease RuvC [Legionellaceae bacterium]|nr:crossover junction endodeoxyribonuclease RuvC [Legionellaceae bacterium]
MAIILGIDPGSRVTGYGVIISEKGQPRYVESGCIRMKSTDLSQRLMQIYNSITELMQMHQPDYFAIEQVFVQHNPRSALVLGHARGAALVAAAQHGVPISEYSARMVKQSLVGYGAAEKTQVQHMVKSMLSLNKAPPADAADALAIAICHGQMCHNVLFQARNRT